MFNRVFGMFVRLVKHLFFVKEIQNKDIKTKDCVFFCLDVRRPRSFQYYLWTRSNYRTGLICDLGQQYPSSPHRNTYCKPLRELAGHRS